MPTSSPSSSSSIRAQIVAARRERVGHHFERDAHVAHRRPARRSPRRCAGPHPAGCRPPSASLSVGDRRGARRGIETERVRRPQSAALASATAARRRVSSADAIEKRSDPPPLTNRLDDRRVHRVQLETHIATSHSRQAPRPPRRRDSRNASAWRTPRLPRSRGRRCAARCSRVSRCFVEQMRGHAEACSAWTTLDGSKAGL